MWQQKVKDFENKLKESEGNSLVWQQKVRRTDSNLKLTFFLFVKSHHLGLPFRYGIPD